MLHCVCVCVCVFVCFWEQTERWSTGTCSKSLRISSTMWSPDCSPSSSSSLTGTLPLLQSSSSSSVSEGEGNGPYEQRQSDDISIRVHIHKPFFYWKEMQNSKGAVYILIFPTTSSATLPSSLTPDQQFTVSEYSKNIDLADRNGRFSRANTRKVDTQTSVQDKCISATRMTCPFITFHIWP